MLVESLAQYSAFLVQEKEYGPEQMKKFFKYELDRYLSGRSREEKRELPLALNEEQTYIHYEKGGLVFYALKDYFGEDWVNGILKGFIKDHVFKEAPFPRALDLVERFRQAAPDDKKYIIDDLFTTITLYNNRAESASVIKQGDKWQVTLEAFTQKLRANELGGEVETPMHDYIDVGIYDKDGHFLYLKKHKLESGHNTIQILVDAQPFKAGVDPLNKLIDRIPDDNTVNISDSASNLKR
jgi:ABC-2 type transport system permease protein